MKTFAKLSHPTPSPPRSDVWLYRTVCKYSVNICLWLTAFETIWKYAMVENYSHQIYERNFGTISCYAEMELPLIHLHTNTRWYHVAPWYWIYFYSICHAKCWNTNYNKDALCRISYFTTTTTKNKWRTFFYVKLCVHISYMELWWIEEKKYHSYFRQKMC